MGKKFCQKNNLGKKIPGRKIFRQKSFWQKIFDKKKFRQKIFGQKIFGKNFFLENNSWKKNFGKKFWEKNFCKKNLSKKIFFMGPQLGSTRQVHLGKWTGSTRGGGVPHFHCSYLSFNQLVDRRSRNDFNNIHHWFLSSLPKISRYIPIHEILVILPYFCPHSRAPNKRIYI